MKNNYKKKYRVRIARLNICNYFYTLEEAKNYRDGLLN